MLFARQVYGGASAGGPSTVDQSECFVITNGNETETVWTITGTPIGTYLEVNINGLEEKKENYSISGQDVTLVAGLIQEGDRLCIKYNTQL